LIAAAWKAPHSAEALLEGGANPNVSDRNGMTPLHTAAQLGALDLARKLIAKGAHINAQTGKMPTERRGRLSFSFDGYTPLMFAARNNHVEIMRLLLEAGADPKIKAYDGTTLLMAAAGSGHLGPVELAYQYDQDVKAVNALGSTVMHAAVTFTLQNSTQEEICRVIKFLADKGAPLDEKDARGRTPLSIADILPIDKAVELLTELIAQSGAKPKIASQR
jgi:ankyrin repeat protein